MKNWKFTIEYKGQLLKLMIDTNYYADPYMQIEKEYPGCIVKNVLEIED
jgi:hypothetical protein